jgi:hypothetical protein
MRLLHSASKRHCQAGEVGELGEGPAFALLQPNINILPLEPESEALATNERDLTLPNHTVNSTGTHTQEGTEFLDRK